MTIKVLGTGFGRTGTHSLKQAVEILGFGPCHHMYEVRKSPAQLSWWRDIAAGGKPDWDQILSGYQSQVDWPGSCFWQDLVAKYPAAKVVLTTRDPEAWYRSVSKTILPSSELGRFKDSSEEGRIGSDIIYRLVLQGIFDGKLADKDHAIRMFNDHIRAVKRVVPREKLLVYDVKEGWAPLAGFLDVPAPDCPFPSSNTVEQFRAKKPYLNT